ncbi:O-antigen ligase [Roseivirga sp. E12]|uniref:O-antigen ligase family protein n=1 Tax=Roseivirga sp. E12 TaxID=2819237 RepID=UPI001ABBECE7|nr:O-antigen ligase family protein [Roseivirga sp. E12]MBO3699073.1 O-antigen ligase family protein [Roseivirga sp. E12]
MYSRLIDSAGNHRRSPQSLWMWLTRGNYLQLSMIHIVLGLSGLLFPYVYIAWVYVLLLTFFSASIKNKHLTLPYLLMYIIPLEVFSRMVSASPFLPWEVAKYLGMLLLIVGIIINRSKSKGLVGLFILILTLPAIFMATATSEKILQTLTFNVFGLINLCLAVIYFANRTLTKDEIAGLFRFFILGSIPILTYSIFRAPTFDEIDFSLGANFELTGGFGSNQVSTILGLAGGLGIWLWLLRIPLFKNSLLNIVVPSIFLAWALLSFSRGGVVSPAIGILLVFLFVKKGNTSFSVRKINVALVSVLCVLMPLLFYFLNKVTDNLLLLRYLGETNKTFAGTQEKDFNLLTTGRWEIFLADIEVWMNNFVFGVGVGSSPQVREQMGSSNIEAHIEISRLLAEHGLFGFIISILFLVIPFYLYFSRKRAFDKAVIIFCMTMAILTSMHSAMRTFITPLFFGLAFIKISSD